MTPERKWNVGDVCTWCNAEGWHRLGLCRGCGKKTCDHHHVEIKGRLYCAPPGAWGCAHNRARQVSP